MLAYEGCARAMYQSWAVLGLGLAVFALSSFVPTQRFGAMMFTLLTAALIGNLIMLPSVLASPLAYFFGRRLVRKAHAEHRDSLAAGDAPSGGHLPPTNGDAASDATARKSATTARIAFGRDSVRRPVESLASSRSTLSFAIFLCSRPSGRQE